MYEAFVTFMAVKSPAFPRKAKLKAPSNRGRVYLCLVLVGVTLLMSACQPEFSLWVVPGSRASSLVLGFSKSRNGEDKLKVDSISVFSCELVREDQAASHYPNPEYAVWSATSSGAVPTNRLPYGQDGFGLRTTHGPESLKSPGCYVVLAYAKDDQGYMGSARIGFKVQNDGQVIEMSNTEYRDLFTQ